MERIAGEAKRPIRRLARRDRSPRRAASRSAKRRSRSPWPHPIARAAMDACRFVIDTLKTQPCRSGSESTSSSGTVWVEGGERQRSSRGRDRPCPPRRSRGSAPARGGACARSLAQAPLVAREPLEVALEQKDRGRRLDACRAERPLGATRSRRTGRAARGRATATRRSGSRQGREVLDDDRNLAEPAAELVGKASLPRGRPPASKASRSILTGAWNRVGVEPRGRGELRVSLVVPSVALEGEPHGPSASAWSGSKASARSASALASAKRQLA